MVISLIVRNIDSKPIEETLRALIEKKSDSIYSNKIIINMADLLGPQN